MLRSHSCFANRWAIYSLSLSSFFYLIRVHSLSLLPLLSIYLILFPFLCQANRFKQTICKHGVCDTSWNQHHQLTCSLFSIYIKSISHMLTSKIYNCKIDFMLLRTLFAFPFLLFRLSTCAKYFFFCRWKLKISWKKDEIKNKQNVSRPTMYCKWMQKKQKRKMKK